MPGCTNCRSVRMFQNLGIYILPGKENLRILARGIYSLYQCPAVEIAVEILKNDLARGIYSLYQCPAVENGRRDSQK